MPSTGLTVGNTFASQSGNVPASELDANYAQLFSGFNTLKNTANFFIDGGSANSIIVTAGSPLVAALALGLPLQIQVAAGNTGATSINVNGTGSQSLVYPGTAAALLPGQLSAGQIISVMYDGTNWEYLGDVFGSGGFSGNITGTTGTIAVTVSWAIAWPMASIRFGQGYGTSNSQELTLTALPTYLQPATAFWVPIPDALLIDNGVSVAAVNSTGASAEFTDSSIVTFYKNGAASGWTNSGTKGVQNTIALVYPLV